MAAQPDFVLYDRYGRLAAVIEIKAKRGTSPEWAAEFRQNLLGHDAFRYAPFFLLVTPDRVYLWKGVADDARAEPAAALPDHQLDGAPLFQPYLRRSRVKLEELHREAFELVVMSWLSDLILQLPDRPLPEQLVDSGLSEAAKDGRITYPTAA